MGYLETIFEAAERLGGDVDKQLKPARDFRARADELNRQLDQARSAEEKAYGELVEAIAAGKVPPGEAAKAAGTWIFDSQASRMIVAAVAACHARAASTARSSGPAIFDALRRRVDQVVAESAKLAATVPAGVDSEASALRASNGDVRHFRTWQRLGELLDEWEAAHELNRLLQRAGWVAGPDHVRDRPGVRPFEAYEKPPPLVVIPRGPRERHLAAAVAAGAGPGLIDWPTAVSRWDRVDRRRREYRVFSSVQSMDAMGNITTLETGPEQPQDRVPLPVGSQPIVPAV